MRLIIFIAFVLFVGFSAGKAGEQSVVRRHEKEVSQVVAIRELVKKGAYPLLRELCGRDIDSMSEDDIKGCLSKMQNVRRDINAMFACFMMSCFLVAIVLSDVPVICSGFCILTAFLIMYSLVLIYFGSREQVCLVREWQQVQAIALSQVTVHNGKMVLTRLKDELECGNVLEYVLRERPDIQGVILAAQDLAKYRISSADGYAFHAKAIAELVGMIFANLSPHSYFSISTQIEEVAKIVTTLKCVILEGGDLELADAIRNDITLSIEHLVYVTGISKTAAAA